MKVNQAEKARVFRRLHHNPGAFVMPNAWNAGSACMLEAAGFAAIGTTSAGIAYSLGLPDYAGVLSKEAALEESSRIALAVTLPVSVDAENGYGHSPEAVAGTIGEVVATGAVGAGIEDYASSYEGGKFRGLYDLELAVERVEAACAAGEAAGIDFTVTARAECFLVDHPDAFAESVRRANAYAEAGAHCLYVPGVKDAETIGALVREIDGPLNVVVGLSGGLLSVTELEDLGVRRISVGGSLARATFGLIRRAGEEILSKGTFGFAEGQVPDGVLCEFFSEQISNREY